MNISIVSAFPKLYEPFLSTSLIARAQEKELIDIQLCNMFDFVKKKERIDAPTFGPGPGMLIKPEIIERAINQQEAQFGPAFKIFFSPQGKKVNQLILRNLHKALIEKKHLIMVAGRYEGIDTRVEEYYANIVLSVGDFVVMGGDLPAMLIIEGLLRLIPEVVGNQISVEHESFTGPFVDYPEFTEPVIWKDKEVPSIVRSGNHAAIEQWRHEQMIEKTVLHHFDWLRSYPKLEDKQKKEASRYIPPHYAALLHSEVLLPDKQVGTTSVTSFDIHDNARSALTYGLKNYFVITPLQDQQKVVQTLLDFWHTDVGITYNPHRHEAVKRVRLLSSLDEVISIIENREGIRPLLIGTSARLKESNKLITYFDQEKVWHHNRPVLFLFGTGKGIAPHILERCDFILIPIEGFTDFNHLSVRSAMAIILDRWLGINKKT